MRRENYGGDSPYEALIGFSRAVRAGNVVCVSGTGPVGADDEPVTAQAERVFTIIEDVLRRAGASLRDVVRTRMYLTSASDWKAVGEVHGRLFGDLRPAATMVVVAQLLNPSWRVEVEADAILSDTE